GRPLIWPVWGRPGCGRSDDAVLRKVPGRMSKKGGGAAVAVFEFTTRMLGLGNGPAPCGLRYGFGRRSIDKPLIYNDPLRSSHAHRTRGDECDDIRLGPGAFPVHATHERLPSLDRKSVV